VTAGDIMRMGVGGLLKEFDMRPLPREKAVASDRAVASHARGTGIAAVVLAAGRSRGWRRTTSCWCRPGGKPMIARVVDNVLSSGARPVWW
jgi:molybdenum cofactor cytidylyltransferase